MGKVKIKKSDVWIDMTPMSDVMTLLLTFFMLTSTFVKPEPVKVNVPKSVSKVDVPANDVLTIIVNPVVKNGQTTDDGQVFLRIDNTKILAGLINDMGIQLTPKQLETFKAETTFGMNRDDLPAYLSMAPSARSKMLAAKGCIPLDSIQGKQSEFQDWVYAYETEMGTVDNVKIAIKSDARTPYKVVRKVMSELQDLGISDYYLITELKSKKED